MASLVENRGKLGGGMNSSSPSLNSGIMGKLRKMSFNNASSSEPIIISGHLYKMKRNPQAMSMSDWNKRFFTIEGDFMFWHKAKGN